MREEFLYYVWQYKLLPIGVKTLFNEEVVIVHPGLRNHDSGPDFFNARVKIGDTLWAGNVEIHLRSSDWYRHGHQNDLMYESIILHVVWEHDLIQRLSKEQVGRTIELKDKIDLTLLDKYESMMTSAGVVPCHNHLNRLDSIVFYKMCERSVFERLAEKQREVQRHLEATRGDWEEAFYRVLARSFGLRVNADGMEQLARSIPVRLVWRNISNVKQAEALYLGQSGLLLGSWEDRWLIELQNEYAYLSRLYHLKSMNPMVWKFARLRPISFPTLRIALFASLIFSLQPLFSKLIGLRTVSEIIELMKVKASDYWCHHYYLKRESTYHNVVIGQQLSELIIINAIVPFLFVHGQTNSDQIVVEKSIRILEELPSEDNAMVRKWETMGVKCENALISQGLLWLDRSYCSRFRCLECGIGHAVLKR